MKKEIKKYNKMKNLLLKILNWLDESPAKYGFINNIENYSREFLEESARMEPDVTLSQFMKDMRTMDNCISQNGDFTVIQNGEFREGTEQDIEDLQTDIGRESVRQEMKKRHGSNLFT